MARPCPPLLLAVSLAMCMRFGAAAAAPLTLNQALAIAEQRNAALRGACAALAASQGEFNEAHTFLANNPEATIETRRRELAQPPDTDARRRDVGFGLSQRFELGGQPQARRGAAEETLRATRAAIDAARREMRAGAAQRFFEVLSLQERARMEAQALDLLRQAAELTRRRLNAGEDTRLDSNLAAIEAERAANKLAQVREQLLQARSTLAAFLQLDPTFDAEAQGDLAPPRLPYSLDELLATASRRPHLAELTARERAAGRRLDLERANAYPDLTVGLFYSPEKSIDATDRITTLSFSLPLPLFRRNAGAIGRALSELDQARIARRAAESETRITVRMLWNRLQNLQQRVERLQREVLPALEENQTLSLKALRAGEIGLPQFLIVRRQALDGQRDLLDARTQLRLAHVALAQAAGLPESLPALDNECPPPPQDETTP